jgi:16S rRNA (uracil1498-N3)-methyltransferase
MTRRRFYAAPESFQFAENTVTLSLDETRHLRDVLRLSQGDQVFVFDGEGHEYDCVISEIARDLARLKIISQTAPANPESPLDLTLGLALLKGEKFDLVVQKTTELGVKRIVPIISQRADIHLKDKSDAQKRMARWQRISVEAAKQSGRALVPAIEPPVELQNLLQAQPRTRELRLMFSERLGQQLDPLDSRVESNVVTALVGSEGGWTDDEITIAKSSGWQIVTLGGRTLRAETAAIGFCALLQHRLGDLR